MVPCGLSVYFLHIFLPPEAALIGTAFRDETIGCELIRDRINTFRSFEIVKPDPHKSFTNATYQLLMEQGRSSSSCARGLEHTEALKVSDSWKGECDKMAQVSSALNILPALRGEASVHIAYYMCGNETGTTSWRKKKKGEIIANSIAVTKYTTEIMQAFS